MRHLPNSTPPGLRPRARPRLIRRELDERDVHASGSGAPPPIAGRAKELLPQVLLTLASIVQALALEVLWSSASDARGLWTTGAERFAGWLQVAAVFEGILLVWLYYAQLLMRFRWVPRVRDSVIPFGFGIGQFAIAELLAPGELALWLYAFGAVFAFAFWTSQMTFKAAALDRDNDWFFARFPQRGLDRWAPILGTVGTFVVLGAITQATGGGPRWAIFALVLVHAMLLAQLALQRWYWHRSMRAASDPL